MAITTQTTTLATIPTARAIAADKVGTASAPAVGDEIQYVKLDIGAAGASSPVTSANPMPASLAAETTKVIGTVNLPAGTNAIGKVHPAFPARSNVSLYAEAVAGIIAETAISINKSVQYAAAVAATSNGPTTGKNLRIYAALVTWVSTSTTANTARLRIRVNPAAAATTASPIAFSARIGWESATFIANESEFQQIPLDIDVPSGGQFMATLACVAANGTLDVQLLAYEYTP